MTLLFCSQTTPRSEKRRDETSVFLHNKQKLSLTGILVSQELRGGHSASTE